MWLLREGGLHQGWDDPRKELNKITHAAQPGLSFRAALTGLSYTGEGSREGDRASGPPPSASNTVGSHIPLHPLGFGGPCRSPQPGEGWLFDTPLHIFDIYIFNALSSFQPRLLHGTGSRERRKESPSALSPALPALGGLPGEGEREEPQRLFAAPGAALENKTNQNKANPQLSPQSARFVRSGGGRSSASDFQRLALRAATAATCGARRGRGAAGPQRVKYARCFPVMHLARCSRRMREE